MVPSNIYDIDFSLSGHSHQYMFDYITGNIKVPTCSTVFPNGKQIGIYSPGFLVLEQYDGRMWLNRYTFEGKNKKAQPCLKLDLR